jgi:hypothetical protein
MTTPWQLLDGLTQGRLGLVVGQGDPEGVADEGALAVGLVLLVAFGLGPQVGEDQFHDHVGRSSSWRPMIFMGTRVG